MQCGRAAVLGAEPAPFPSPLPPASCLRWGWAGPQLASSSGLARSLCSVNCWQCVWAGYFLSFTIPQFKLVTHKSFLRLPSGHSGPDLTLSNAARSSPFCPHLLVAGAGIWGTFLLGVAFRHVICGPYLIFPPS